jgi:alanine-glyoxylate transaminase/serine-glyoxylate transaminase/serine-pyruvate transaminase
MSLSQGRQYLAIPGPSVMPDRVLQAMHQPSPNIYEGGLIEMTHSLIPDLKHVAGTEGQAVIYIANGHGAWEAAVSNVLAAGHGTRFSHGPLLRGVGRNGQQPWRHCGNN